MTRFLLFLSIVAACRAADLITTWLVTPDLRFERNPIMQRIGWTWALALNPIACLAAAFEQGVFFYALCFISVLAAIWNARIFFKLSS